ncbi:MAG TPA: GNAT family N-acetyltransferase [Desulfobacterales bacterium]|nr:GNAT family N-acetyltransferase [Desulfobacterales bacterium]
MPTATYWADAYLGKRRSAAEAIRMVKSGQRIFIGSACGQPQALVRALSDAAPRLSGLEIVRLLSTEATPLGALADQTQDFALNLRTIYLGAANSEVIARHLRFITPMNMSDVPDLFISKKLPIHAALIQVSPPDDFGWMSLGISVDVTLAAAMSADLVIAQVNPQMPRVLGQSFIHVNDVDIVFEHEEPLLSVDPRPASETATRIGQMIARLVEDGSTIQIGLDAASQATLQALGDKNDLGVHSQFLTDDMMHLFSQGAITNRCKGFNDGKLVASAAIGSRNLYEFLDNNPAVDFRPSDYVNDPFIIARHQRMVSMNVARTMDLTGQVEVEAAARTFFAGVSGTVDFVRGARRSPGGKSILMLFSTSEDGQHSSIVPILANTNVGVPRADVHYVVTEYGAFNLLGKSLQERVVGMISVAHPKFREELFVAAKQLGLIGPERTLGEAVRGVYPVRLEETMEIDGEEVVIRPAKPVDERRIQEHYYSLNKEDIFSRFRHEKTSFSRSDVEVRSLVDYVRDLTLVAVVGEFGFGQVVALGECMLIEKINMAEVAFSVNKKYQNKGIGRRILRKLSDSAREKGLFGLMAYTSPSNQGMIRMFKSLPYKVKSTFDGEGVTLSCRFDELA